MTHAAFLVSDAYTERGLSEDLTLGEELNKYDLKMLTVMNTYLYMC